MSGRDRLSSLPDDLLRRVLYFAPVREAESTSALSKRWRGLWCSSGAVNLDECVPNLNDDEDDDVAFFSRRGAFVSAARMSLEAAAADGSTVTRLTFRVEAVGGYMNNNTLYKFLCRESGPNWSRSTDVVAELLSLPETRRVEELQLAAAGPSSFRVDMSDRDREVTSASLDASSSFVTLKFTSLSSETLRMLDITSFRGLTATAGIAFPQLASLRLSFCSVSSEHLRSRTFAT